MSVFFLKTSRIKKAERKDEYININMISAVFIDYFIAALVGAG